MTPAERVVVEAARAFIRAAVPRPDELQSLDEAVAALDAERFDSIKDGHREIPTTWDQVVEGDEIYSAKTRRWYEVREAGALPEGRRKIVAAGLPRPIKPMAVGDVLVRRGRTGQAVDMFASVLWSMPTTPSLPAASIDQAPAEVPDVAQDPEASEDDDQAT